MTINVQDGSTVNYTFEWNGQPITALMDAGSYSAIRPVLSPTLSQAYTLNSASPGAT